jgi:putative ABC transport system permease protein
VMNVMVIAVAQRRSEVGLLVALGADARTVRQLFLGEALLLSLTGAVVGLAIGEGGTHVIARLAPVLTPGVPAIAALAAMIVAIAAGVAFGTGPARRAARLDPIQALARR